MTDDLVKRLRSLGFKPYTTYFDAADAIERLTRERDEARQNYVDANEARIDAERELEGERAAHKITAQLGKTSDQWFDALITDLDARSAIVKLHEQNAEIIRLTRERDSARVTMSEALRPDEAIARAEAAERKVEKLRGALKPFAKWCDDMEREHPKMFNAEHDDARVASDVTIGDARRARAALNETEDK